MKKNDPVLIRQRQVDRIVKYLISIEGMYPAGATLSAIEEATRVHRKYLEGPDGILEAMIKGDMLEGLVSTVAVTYRLKRKNN
jgi:hypothetical protein